MEPIDLEVPDWVPRGVAAFLRHIDKAFASSPDAERWAVAREVLRRFAADPRMKKVWREVFKRKGGAARGGDFLHPVRHLDCTRLGYELACQMTLGLPERDLKQEQAAVLLISNLLRFFGSDPRAQSGRARSEKQVASEVEGFRAEAARMQESAAFLLQQGQDDRAEERQQAAADYEQEARRHEPYPHDPYFVGRQTDRVLDSRERAFVIEAAGSCRSLFGEEPFGNRMLGTVATLANVALGRIDLSADSIRNATSIPGPDVPIYYHIPMVGQPAGT